jgi:hypothetical protein
VLDRKTDWNDGRVEGGMLEEWKVESRGRGPEEDYEQDYDYDYDYDYETALKK